MNVPQATEGIGLAGLTVGIMATFGAATLAIVFFFHSILESVYSLSVWAGIPFLVVLAAPFWLAFLAACAINTGRWLLKHKA